MVAGANRRGCSRRSLAAQQAATVFHDTVSPSSRRSPGCVGRRTHRQRPRKRRDLDVQLGPPPLRRGRPTITDFATCSSPSVDTSTARTSAQPCRSPSSPRSPGRPLPALFGDEEGRGFVKTPGPNVISVFATQPLQLCAFIASNTAPVSPADRARRWRRTQTPGACSPTPISAAT